MYAKFQLQIHQLQQKDMIFHHVNDMKGLFLGARLRAGIARVYRVVEPWPEN
jgi:hypothetical protein